MKKCLHIILAIVLAAYCALSVLSEGNCSSRDTARFSNCNTSGDCTGNLTEFHGYIAHNALNGTSETLDSADRHEFVFRNSNNGWQGFSCGSSKRHVQTTLRFSSDSCMSHSCPARYSLNRHNVTILDDGMSSNSERIHLLHVLII